LRFDPRVFKVSASDVRLGSLTSNSEVTAGLADDAWQLTADVNSQSGEIGIVLFSLTPIPTTAGGSLVTIDMHIQSAPPPGLTTLALVNQVNPTGLLQFRTSVADAQGMFVLHSFATADGIEPGAPSQIMISAATVSTGASQEQSTAPAVVEGLPSRDLLPPTNALSATSPALSPPVATLIFTELWQDSQRANETALLEPAPMLNLLQDTTAATCNFDAVMPLHSDDPATSNCWAPESIWWRMLPVDADLE
jgi:hypothetical protein